MDLKEKYISVISALMINTASNLFSMSSDEKRKKMVDSLERIGKKSSDLDQYENEVRDIISNLKDSDQNLSKILSLHKEVIDGCISTLKKFGGIDNNSVSKMTKDYIKAFLYNLSEISKKGNIDLSSYDRVSEKAIKLVRNIYAQSRALKEVSPSYSDVAMEFIPTTKSLIEKITDLDLHKTIKKDERKEIMKQVDSVYKSEVSFQKAVTEVLNSLLKEIKKEQNSSFMSSNSDSIREMEELIIKKKEMDSSLNDIFSSMIEEDEKIIDRMESEIFPIKVGDKDNLRFNGNPIIKTIQKALSSYDSTMAKTIERGGGDNGTYNIFTSIVISAIKKQSGDKDYKNPDLTKHIFDMMVEGGIFTRTQLESLKRYIAEIPEDEYVSESMLYESAEDYEDVLSFDTFSSIFSSLGPSLSEAFKIDREKIQGDIQDIAREKRDETEFRIEKEEAISSNLAKKLRKIGVSCESDDFVTGQKTYRKGYDRNFLEAWIQAIDEEGNDVRFFSYDGGVYFAKSKEASLATPLNFPKFLRDVESQDDVQNREDVVFNLIKCFSVYGGFPSRAKVEKSKFEDLRSFTYNGNAFPHLKGSKPLDKIGGDKGFLTSEDATKLYEMMKDMVTASDLDYPEFAAVNNIIIYSGNLVFQEGGKYTPFSKKITGLFTSEMMKKLKDDRMLGDDNSEVFLLDNKVKESPIYKDKNSSKSTLRDNLEKMIKRVEKGHGSMENLCSILNSRDGKDLNDLKELYKVYQVKSDSLSF